MIKLPGLIDPHVHVREPGAVHKEDWDTGTAAALAGGFTMLLAMPNTQPPVIDNSSLAFACSLAEQKARCDYGFFLGASPTLPDFTQLSSRVAGVKMYLNQTFGSLRLDDMSLWMDTFASVPADMPIAVHAERHTLGAILLLAHLYERAVHVCHVSRRDEILLIRAAREKGIQVTCEVAPHHLFLSYEDFTRLGSGRSQVRPDLASKADQQALWDNMDIIDCFATDHAPHTLQEKDGPKPPPGFPGLETALPLLLTAVYEGRLTLDDIVARCYTNPQRIFHLPKQPETWVEVDENARWTISASQTLTRCGWTPFEGFEVQGKVQHVVLRGKEAYSNGSLLAQPGYGKNIRKA